MQDGGVDNPTQALCPQCEADGTMFFVSRFARPLLQFFRCSACGHRWIVPVTNLHSENKTDDRRMRVGRR